MIDENKLLEELKHHLLEYKKDDTAIGINVVREITNNQPKIYDWIPCDDYLPEEKTNPITQDFYEYQVTYRSGDTTDVRHYKFGNGHWWNDGEIMDDYVTAWRSQIEPYYDT